MPDSDDYSNHSAADAYLFSAAGGLIAGAVAGAIGGLVLPLLYGLINPAYFQDGLGFLVFLLTLPVGAAIGAIAGGVIACVMVARERAKL